MTSLPCKVDGCNSNNYGFGYCRLHYRRLIRTGSLNAKPVTTHGKSKTLTYGVWANMLYRCNNPKASNYKFYGGKGIKVCDRWKSFENFLADMGEKPNPNDQIDRIDNNGNYEPDNCRWVSSSKNIRNRSISKLNESDLIIIRKMLKEKIEQKSIAQQFSVSRSTISSIATGLRWQNE